MTDFLFDELFAGPLNDIYYIAFLAIFTLNCILWFCSVIATIARCKRFNSKIRLLRLRFWLRFGNALLLLALLFVNTHVLFLGPCEKCNLLEFIHVFFAYILHDLVVFMFIYSSLKAARMKYWLWVWPMSAVWFIYGGVSTLLWIQRTQIRFQIWITWAFAVAVLCLVSVLVIAILMRSTHLKASPNKRVLHLSIAWLFVKVIVLAATVKLVWGDTVPVPYQLAAYFVLFYVPSILIFVYSMIPMRCFSSELVFDSYFQKSFYSSISSQFRSVRSLQSDEQYFEAHKFEKPKAIDVVEWNMKDVHKWVRHSSEASIHQYAHNFYRNYVTGLDLLQCSEEILREIGISSKLHINKILREVRALKIMCFLGAVIQFRKGDELVRATVIDVDPRKLCPHKLRFVQSIPDCWVRLHIIMSYLSDMDGRTNIPFEFAPSVSFSNSGLDFEYSSRASSENISAHITYQQTMNQRESRLDSQPDSKRRTPPVENQMQFHVSEDTPLETNLLK